MKRKLFALGAVAALLASSFGEVRADAPILKFGLVSDVHLGGEGKDADLENVLRHFDAQGVDAVMIPGDIAHSGLIAEFERFAAIWYGVFPNDRGADGRKVERLIVGGNHCIDAWSGRWKGWSEERLHAERFNYADNPQKTWRRLFNEDWQPIFVKTVKGIPFVGAQWKSEQAPFVKPPVAETVARLAPTFDPKLPFFVFQHNAPAGTCFGGAGDAELAAALRPHPNAVSVSGHYHRSVADDRNVWQGEFTALSAGCLHEAAGGEGYRNVNYHWHAPSRTKPMRTTEWISRGGCCSVVEVFADRLVVHRRSVQTSEPLGEDWAVPIPAVAGKGFDFKVRARETVAPEFAAGAKVTVTYCPKGHPEQAKRYAGKPCVAVAFPEAQTPRGVVREYEVVAARQDGRELVRTKVIPNGFGLAKERMTIPGVCLFKTEELPEERPVVFSVTARECFGKTGRPIESAPFSVSGVLARNPGFVWIEAEDFAEKGDWQVDTQFTHAMGSAYLICPGLNAPTKNPARTQVTIPETGEWTLWARTKDWVPEFSPGRFAIEVNGARSGVLGATKRGWSWEKVGRYAFKSGAADLALVDLSGAFARCDALVFARDTAYVPPDGADALARERMRLSGTDDTVSDGGSYDLIVIGSGPGGIGASVAAARHGARTLLLHDRPVIGGNCSSECGIGLGGAFLANDGVRECGLAEEARLRRARLVVSRPDGRASWTEAFRQMTDPLAPTLSVVGDKRVMRVEKEGGRIAAVIARDTRTGRWTRYRAAYFADATGDGWIGRFAGAASMYGREAGSEYGEEWIAPEKRDELTMSGSIMGGCMGYRIRRLKEGVAPAYETPAWARVLPKGFDREAPGPQAPWWLENPGRIDDLHTPEEARDNLIRVAFAYFGWVQNEWKGRDAAKSVVLDCVPFNYARREGWRLRGDHVLAANECRAGMVFPDAVSGGGWSLDTHDPLGMDNPGGDGWWRTHPLVPAYTLPFRCLYSTNVPNLFLSSRCISMTHIALGSVRVGGTVMALGQAAGTAAALCVKRGLLPRAYGQGHVSELQRTLLRDDQSIPGVRDADPANLALAAKASDPALNDGWAYPAYDRTVRGRMNASRGWESEPSLPQTATLEWSAPVELGEVQVVFDSELKVQNLEAMPRSLVKAYRLEVRTASGWERVADVNENFLRVRLHRFAAKKVDALRVTVRATWGDACARIFEVRAYGPDSPSEGRPFLSMRLRANDTETLDGWRANFKEIVRHSGCCDEIWFSTGCGAPKLDWHRANAAVLAEAVKGCRAKGIVPSLQFQATLGHGDAAGTPELFVMKSWTGWTGPAGVETKYCNCPRQSAFLDYLREVSRIYAPIGFGSLWIDDDLRIEYHEPSGSFGKRPGCWCATCLAAFNAETDTNWTRTELAQAVMTNDVVAAEWRRFQTESLCGVAKAIAEEFHALSPETKLGLQHASYDGVAESTGAILKTLHGISGRPVGSRPGGGSYYDDNPSEVVLKSIASGRFRGRLGDPDWVNVWTPEIESWPRTYYSRSPQGVLVEGFAALMYGMNAISFFVSNGAKEDPTLYGRTYWKALEMAAPVLRGYARAIAGCRPVGFTMPGKAQIGIRRAAIPVLAGLGRSCGELAERERALNVNMMTSADVQKLRDDLDRRAGGLSAVVCSPFLGLMQLHESASGDFRALALVNMRISDQGPIVVRLRPGKFPEGVATWHELCREPKVLPVERKGDAAFVTIPSLGAWNGGYLTVKGMEDVSS